MVQDTIVTVRMPKTLLEAVKEQTTQDHFSDLSEQIRSIVRKSCLRHTDPVRLGLDRLQNHMLASMEERIDQKKNEELIQELKKLMESAK